MLKKKNFEKSLKRLEEITEQMDKNEISLEKSVNLYKEGVQEAMACAEILKDVEQEVSVLQKNAEGVFRLSKLQNMEEY